MKVTISAGHLTVIDDYLPAEEFEALSDQVASHRYPTRLNFVRSSQIRYAMNSAIYLTDQGRELVGTIASEAARRRVLTALPAGDAADAITSRFDEVRDLLQSTVGLAGSDWLGYTRGFFRSNAGASMGWHNDEKVYSGAYVFYASRHWEADWGGELCVRPPLGDISGLSPAHRLDALDQGQYIFPRPNRLALIRGGTPHRVSPVTVWAQAPRYSVAGFFVTGTGLLAQEKELQRRYLSLSTMGRAAVDIGLRLVRGKA
jgi:hypothetical protein